MNNYSSFAFLPQLLVKSVKHIHKPSSTPNSIVFLRNLIYLLCILNFLFLVACPTEKEKSNKAELQILIHTYDDVDYPASIDNNTASFDFSFPFGTNNNIAPTTFTIKLLVTKPGASANYKAGNSISFLSSKPRVVMRSKDGNTTHTIQVPRIKTKILEHLLTYYSRDYFVGERITKPYNKTAFTISGVQKKGGTVHLLVRAETISFTVIKCTLVLTGANFVDLYEADSNTLRLSLVPTGGSERIMSSYL